MEIHDPNFYPKKFKSFRVTSSDDDGNPLTTVFYSDAAFTTEVFRWVRTFDENGNTITWKIQ